MLNSYVPKIYSEFSKQILHHKKGTCSIWTTTRQPNDFDRLPLASMDFQPIHCKTNISSSSCERQDASECLGLGLFIGTKMNEDRQV